MLIGILSIILFFLLILLSFCYKKDSRKKKLHKSKINYANKVFQKIKTLDGDHKAACAMSYLKKIDPYVFEELLLTAFQKEGFKVIRGERYSGDNGIDGTMYREKRLYLIQAKRYAGRIKKQHVLEFINVVNSKNALGFFIHTGTTGDNIFQLVQGTNVEILSGQKLINLLLQ